MFKKSFAALAVLGFCASYANASSVILYGVVDEALVFTHEKFDVTGEEGTKTNTFGLESGLNAPSRFGLRGVEDLGNGLQVSFVAENSFSADDGSLGMGRLFGRELSATVSGDFGRVSLGRMGGVGSSAGSYDLVYAYGDAFDGGDNNIFGLAASSRYDNMVTYQTPDFAGVKTTVQYSFNEDSVNDKSFGTDVNPSVEDGHTVYLGGNYDFGVTRLFAMAQYFKGLSATQLTAIADETRAETADNMWSDGAKGYGLHLGTVTPVFGGDFTAGLYFVDAKFQNGANAANQNDADLSYYGAALRYGYPLSKRTTVYTGVGYGVSKLEFNNNGQDVEAKNQVGQAYLGLTHMF